MLRVRRRRPGCAPPRSARAPASSRARPSSRSASRPARRRTDNVTSTRGVVSSESTTFRDPSPDVPAYHEAVQTDTALNPGYSGGPLADLDGRLDRRQRRGAHDGLGRPAAPGPELRDRDRPRAATCSRELRRGRSIGWTGATFGYPTTEELQQRRLPPGLYLTGAVPGTPAAAAGLGGRGEVLAGVDGRAHRPVPVVLLRGRRGPARRRASSGSRSRGRAGRRARSRWRWRERARRSRRSSPAAARAGWGRRRRWSSSAAGRCSRGRSPRRATRAWRRSSSPSRVGAAAARRPGVAGARAARASARRAWSPRSSAPRRGRSSCSRATCRSCRRS